MKRRKKTRGQDERALERARQARERRRRLEQERRRDVAHE